MNAPAMLAQPLLAPLAPVALFAVVTIDDGGEQQVPRRPVRLGGH